MFGVGMSELIVILLVALVVLGPDKLPEVARLLAKGLAEFRKARQGLRDVLDEQSEKTGFKGAFNDLKDTVADAVSEVHRPIDLLKEKPGTPRTATPPAVPAQVPEEPAESAGAQAQAPNGGGTRHG